ncbi:MAG: GNAT family N-acetyltransferase [Promethearchaeota archaeon]
MKPTLRNIKDSDGYHITSIINYFTKNSFAAFPNKEVGIEFFIALKKEAIAFYMLEINKEPVGFCCLRKYNPFETFSHTGLLTYFILPEYTKKGFGTLMLSQLINDAESNGINNLLACIASQNIQSIKFHEKHGFIECGRFKNVGYKFNQFFDLVWMQKFLTES